MNEQTESRTVQEIREEHWKDVVQKEKAARDEVYKYRREKFLPVDNVKYRVSPTTGLQVPIKPKKLQK